jgi:hypothetical protein
MISPVTFNSLLIARPAEYGFRFPPRADSQVVLIRAAALTTKHFHGDVMDYRVAVVNRGIRPR